MANGLILDVTAKPKKPKKIKEINIAGDVSKTEKTDIIIVDENIAKKHIVRKLLLFLPK